MQFTTRLMLALSGTVLVGATTMVTVGGGQTAKLLEQQLVARLEENAHHMLEKLDKYFYERVFDARSIVADPAFVAASDSPEKTLRYLRGLEHLGGRYDSAAFYTNDWEVVADTAVRRAGVKEALEGCRADLQTGIDFAICVGRDSPEDEPAIRLVLVARVDGASRGALVLRMPIQVLEDQLPEPSGFRVSNETLHVDLVDNRGVFLYSNHEEEAVLREISPGWSFVQERMRTAGDSGSLKYFNPAEETGEEILVYVRKKGFRDSAGSAWTLILFVPTEEIFAPAGRVRLTIATIVLCTATSLLTIMFFLIRSFTRPLKELGRAAREIEKGDLEARVPAGARDELGLFAGTFNQMAASLQESQRALAESNRKLEEKVEERTLELLHTNEALHAELSERVKAQEALQVRERLLRLNADIGEVLTQGAALPAVLQRCAECVVSNLEAAFVRIWMLGDDKGILELKASAGMYTRLDGQHGRKIVGELKIGIIAKEQRPILTNAVFGDPNITDQEWARREGMVAFAGHPLLVDGQTVGVLALFSRLRLEPVTISALGIVADKIAAFAVRKQAEESLRKSEKRYRDLVDASTDGIYATNTQGAFTSMNPAGARIFGYENPEDLIGQPVLDFWRDPGDRDAFLKELRLKSSVSSYRIKARKKNGEFLEIECSSRILQNNDGSFLEIQGVLRDVTARVKAEAERDLLLAQLQEAAANIKTLSGLLPICSGCKKIRDDQGSWSQIETYIGTHSEAQFTHGLCPDCREVYFPGSGGKP